MKIRLASQMNILAPTDNMEVRTPFGLTADDTTSSLHRSLAPACSP